MNPDRYKIYFIILLLFLAGCLEDNIEVINPPSQNITAQLLNFFEAIGDFPNTIEAPGLITAAQLYSDPAGFIVLDIRSADEYSLGHIEGSVNVSFGELFELADSISGINSDQKILLVSKNGQSSAYFVSLLRLAGFRNTYSLNYGMAAWHEDFAEDWFNALGSHPNILEFNNVLFPKNNFTSLPVLVFPDSLGSVEGRAKYRIKQVIQKGFVENINFRRKLVYTDEYVICYGEGRLYYSPGFSVYPEMGHSANVRHYMASTVFDFRSVNFLQTLPPDRNIIIYSGDGQLSSCMAAYLTALGYKAQTLLFGANQLFYPRLQTEEELFQYRFWEGVIGNYPYVQGY